MKVVRIVDFHSTAIRMINDILDNGLPEYMQGSKTSRKAVRDIQNPSSDFGPAWRAREKSDLKHPLIGKIMFSLIGRGPYEYFVNLGQLQDGIQDLWPYVNSLGYRVEILSAGVPARIPSEKTAEDGKKEWIMNNLEPSPSNITVVQGARNKVHNATNNGVSNILIDDRADTINSWNNAGGIGILHKTGGSKETIRNLKSLDL